MNAEGSHTSYADQTLKQEQFRVGFLTYFKLCSRSDIDDVVECMCENMSVCIAEHEPMRV